MATKTTNTPAAKNKAAATETALKMQLRDRIKTVYAYSDKITKTYKTMSNKLTKATGAKPEEVYKYFRSIQKLMNNLDACQAEVDDIKSHHKKLYESIKKTL